MVDFAKNAIYETLERAKSFFFALKVVILEAAIPGTWHALSSPYLQYVNFQKKYIHVSKEKLWEKWENWNIYWHFVRDITAPMVKMSVMVRDSVKIKGKQKNRKKMENWFDHKNYSCG